MRTIRRTRSTDALRWSTWKPRPRRNNALARLRPSRQADFLKPNRFQNRPADRQADGLVFAVPDFLSFEKGIAMKKIVLAASLLLISATAHAGIYSVEGVTVHVQDGCMSSRCVAVY